MIQRKITPELVLWSLLPGILALLLLLLSLSPLKLPGLVDCKPALVLAALFYWGLFHPQEMPFWYAFLLGLLQDALTGLPLGLTALLYVIFLAMLHPQRKLIGKATFIAQWIYFAVAVTLFHVLQWLVTSLLLKQLFSPFSLLWPLILLVLVYPALHKLFDAVQHIIAKRRWMRMHGR